MQQATVEKINFVIKQKLKDHKRIKSKDFIDWEMHMLIFIEKTLKFCKLFHIFYFWENSDKLSRSIF